MADRRPNILFLMSDEHRPDVVGYEGNSVVRTPVLDELARTGTVFRNAYTPSPICVPARQCMLKLSLVQPHHPYQIDAERFGYCLNRVTSFLNQTLPDHPLLSRRSVTPGVDVSEGDMRRATAAYYGIVEAVDTRYGQILETLEYVGQDLDDWIVIYTSDQVRAFRARLAELGHGADAHGDYVNAVYA